MILFQDDNEGFPVRLIHNHPHNAIFPYHLEQFQSRAGHIPLNTVRLTEEAMLKLKAALIALNKEVDND